MELEFLNRMNNQETRTEPVNAKSELRGRRAIVAVVQAAPVIFDRDRTIDKVRALATDAASQGAQLVLFPEAFVSAYPRGLNFGAVIGARSEQGREDFRRYWESSVDVPGPAVDALGLAARENRIHLVIGVVERAGGTLYCSVLFLRPMAACSASTARSCPPVPSAWSGGLAMARPCRSSIPRSGKSAR